MVLAAVYAAILNGMLCVIELGKKWISYLNVSTVGTAQWVFVDGIRKKCYFTAYHFATDTQESIVQIAKSKHIYNEWLSNV